jgi:hypothetical protein
LLKRAKDALLIRFGDTNPCVCDDKGDRHLTRDVCLCFRASFDAEVYGAVFRELHSIPKKIVKDLSCTRDIYPNRAR